MRIVAAHAPPFLVRVPCRLRGTGMLVAEFDMTMGEIEDRLQPLPTGSHVAEQPPCGVGQPIGFAIPAAKQVHEDVVGQFFDRMLDGTGRSPVPVISNTPSSLAAPNRFFTARTTRCE